MDDYKSLTDFKPSKKEIWVCILSSLAVIPIMCLGKSTGSVELSTWMIIYFITGPLAMIFLHPIFDRKSEVFLAIAVITISGLYTLSGAMCAILIMIGTK